MQLCITDAGKELLIGCLADGDTLTFTAVAFGDGAQEDPAAATALANQIHIVNDPTVAVNQSNEEVVDLGLTFSNTTINSGFRITEMGVFAHGEDNETILFAYGTEEENNADYIPAISAGQVEMVLTIYIHLGDTSNITITTVTSAVETLAAALAAHVADTGMHGATLEEIGAASENHTHAASDIVSGTLSVGKGGTGKSSFTAKAVLIGNGTGAISEAYPSKGALFSPASGEMPRFGTLPVGEGGTGHNNHQTNSILLGNGTSSLGHVRTTKGAAYAESTDGILKFGTLPVDKGGTGAVNAAGARNNLGAVSKAGDTMTGNLKVSVDGLAQFRAENNNQNVGRSVITQLDMDGVAQLWNYKDGSNAQWLNVLPETEDLDKAASVTRRVAGNSTVYRLFGEHNTALLASIIQSLLQGGDVSVIKSIQRGKYTGTGASVDTTITINTVDPAKTKCNLLGISYTGVLGSTNPSDGYIELTSATGLHIVADSRVSGVCPIVSYEIIEYY